MWGFLSRTLLWALPLLLASGCAVFWEGELEQDGHRRIHVYEVQPGDTLSRIAWRHGLRVEQLQRWNEIENPRQMQAGTRLVLNPPVDGSSSSASSSGDGDGEGGSGSGATSQDDNDPPREPPSPPQEELPSYELDWVWPANGDVERSYATDSGGKSGIQIGGEVGDTVRAAAAGEVVYSGSGLRGYGNLIILMHDERFLSAYGYNRRLLVEEGDQVEAGDAIAEMGRAPGAEVASLHFEIRVDGEVVDPEVYLPERD
ncbi:MAG: peptidoglycan DD-metalloendopeptidase family protein [Halorhodospira sp.]